MRRVTPRSSQTVARESFVEEAPVVADQHQRRARSRELVLQPFDRRQVEMVGRLVEQQDVGLGREHARERGAARLAAGKARGVFVAGEPELFEQVARAMRIVARRKARLDIGERGGKARQVRLLRQIADGRAGLREARAAIGLDGSGRDLQQRRLARAVAADQADALALADGKLGALEQRRAAKGEVDVLQGEEGRGHLFSFATPACGARASYSSSPNRLDTSASSAVDGFLRLRAGRRDGDRAADARRRASSAP